MKKVVLYGAFDRYNFGDNLMPIIFESYCQKYKPELLDKIDFIYSAMSESDLSRYSCLKTKNINNVVKDLRAGDVIVVVGGEVLCATSFTLFTHIFKPKFLNDAIKFVNKVPYINTVLRYLTNIIYHAPWSYPYIPDQAMLNDGVKIIYNTVGGNVSSLQKENRQKISQRLEKSDFISVRDKRTYDEIYPISKETKLAPDSVFLVSSLCDNSFINNNVRQDLIDNFNYKYIVFQAAPTKAGHSLEELSNKLKALSKSLECKIVLLPIGYASGHDDYYFLKKINKLIPDCTTLAYNLNVWEILYIIKNSKAYIGTSLHGAIIAMSYSVPHYGLNKKIKKLDAFLNDWSIAPFNRCYSIDEISDVILNNNSDIIQYRLEENRVKNLELVKNNFEEIIKVINFDK
ncbi:polysaccharide pyruvyl transferase family protein [Vibrio casei]|uniref:polysaccharide pyruvyl transferase family protein n=1 Tax=Vibrio casei TaxID=673372 RepID=UPI003F953A62